MLKGRPSKGTNNHLMEVGAMVLGAAVSSWLFSSLTFRVEACRVEEHKRKLPEQVVVQMEYTLFDFVLILFQPGHHPVQAIEVKPLSPWNFEIAQELHPLPVRT